MRRANKNVYKGVGTVPLSEPASAFQTEMAEYMGVPPKRFDVSHTVATQLGLLLRKDAESNKEAEKYTDRGDVRVECAGACHARRSILI